MKLSYNVDEVFEIAQQIERNGVAFYRRAAEFSDSETACDLFMSLADQEEEHERTFAGMREKLVPAQSRVAVHDKDDIVAIYLQALAGRAVFNRAEEPEDVLAGTESPVEILQLAIGKERDAIMFYVSIRDLTGSAEDRGKIERIIRQEQQHAEDLAARLETAKE